MDTANLIAYLPFDESTTQDLCGNEWTATGAVTIADGAANFNYSYLRSNGQVTFGGADFTIGFYTNMSSSSNQWGGLFCVQPTTNTGNNNNAGRISFFRNSSSNNLALQLINGSNTTIVNGETVAFNFLNALHHFELDYTHSNSTLKLFVDGRLTYTISATIERLARYFYLGCTGYDPNGQRMTGSIDEFLLYDGVALHTENFNPPTDEDYKQLKLMLAGVIIPVTLNCDVERKVKKTVELAVDVERQISNSNFLVANFDVERKVIKSVQVNADVERIIYRTWRYENAGTADTLTISGTTLTNLPESKSVTGTAFYQTLRVKCFDLPATPEIWIKFDVYFDGSNRWRAYNGGTNGDTGVCVESGNFCYFVNQGNSYHQQFANVQKTNTLQTVLLHMKSDSSAGIVEAWVDGEKIYTYTGDVNHGADFADIYLQSDGSGTFFSNVIISNRKLDFGDGWHTIYFDTERRITKSLELNFDVERVLIAPVIVPFIGEHFNHIIGSLNLTRGGKKKIILPKKSEVYIRAVGAGIIKVYSDTNTDGETAGVDYFTQNNLYARLDECETVYIEMSKNVSSQHVIKAFMKSLCESTVSSDILAQTTLNNAVSDCTGGTNFYYVNFTTGEKGLVIDFINDLNNSASYTDFLRDYCDIILGNEDTGAITGSDASGKKIKTAQSIVPEKISVEDWIAPDYSETVTIDGLNVHFPTRGLNGRFTDAEKYILAGLNSVWIEQSLALIEESTGLSFNNSEVLIRDITVKFDNAESNTAVAAVAVTYENKILTALDLIVNMNYCNDIDITSEDGQLPDGVYLDRILAHEFTHAVMAANIKYYRLLTSVIKEGAAELVHGIDDLREDNIVELLTTRRSSLKTILLNSYSSNSGDIYAAGYMILRYLAKQGQNQNIVLPDELELTNLLISDGATDSNYNALTDNTRQILYPDVVRTLAKTCELNFDVEIMDVVRVDFTVDVKRALLEYINVFPMNSEDFYSDENNPYVVRGNKSRLKKLRVGQSRSPFDSSQNSAGMQSFEVAIAEQQVTDQVRFTRVYPASADYFKQFSMNIGQWDMDIMQEIRGKYLDYEYNMRVERIQRQGRIYSCECCSDIDKLLYTQLAYKVPATTAWTSGEGTTEQKTIETVYPKASAHAELIAEALGLTFNAKEHALFGDFLSTVLMDDMGGVTYNDLIRDIFGWSARIPHKMINVCIRNNTLFFIERGNEPNMIDISEAEKTEPIITRELIRTTWGSTPTSKTETMTTKKYNRDNDIKYSQLGEIPGLDISDLLQELNELDYPSTSEEVHKSIGGGNESANVKSSYEYDDENLIKRSETTSTDENGTPVSRIITEYKYEELKSGRKFLAREIKTEYEFQGSGWNRVGETIIEHTPLMQGQEHVAKTDEDGDSSDTVGQALPDNRVTPLLEQQWQEDKEAQKKQIKEKIFERIREWAKEYQDLQMEYLDEIKAYTDALSDNWEDSTLTRTVGGLSLYDSSFPIHNAEKLTEVTQDLKALNRSTKETVHVTVYNFPHLIDFLDRIVLYGGVYHLANNIARSTQDILCEQQLTLVKWDLSAVEE